MGAGQIIKNRYQLTEVVKEDVLTVIYRVYDLNSQQYFWAHCYKPEHLSESLIQRLRNLAASLVRLAHPGILKVVDFFSEEGVFWLITESSQGVTLKNYLQTKGKLNSEESLEIILQLVAGLHYASKNLLAHGSLDPEKIIIENDGRVRFYGLALETSIIAETYAKSGLLPVRGTFFSPEHFRGEFFRESSDLYSLGVIFYYLLVGQPPFNEENNAGLAHQHQNEAPDISKIKASRILVAIVTKLLQKDPARRFSSWENFVEFLRSKKLFPAEVSDYDQSDKNEMVVVEKANKLTNFLKRIFWVLLLFGAGVFTGLILSYFIPAANFLNPEITIPLLRDQTFQEAEEALKLLGLKPVVGGEMFDSQIEKGRVIFSEPREKTIVREGRIVKLYLSSGRTLIKVPNLVGLDLETAQKIMGGTDFKLELADDSRMVTDPKALIVAQSPLPDVEADFNSEVVISLVNRRQLATVILPDFSGRELLQVKEKLRELNLNLGRVLYQNSAASQKDKVLQQNPASGAKIVSMMPVDLVVGGGAEFNGVAVRFAKVDFKLPVRDKLWLVELKVEDTSGVYSVYKNFAVGDSQLNWTVVGLGESVLRVYLDGLLVEEKKF
jgi:serine/threonine-protein kinase